MTHAKPTIVIMECYSTAVNYIRDIRERGYEPALLECRVPPARREKERAANDKAYAFVGDPLPVILTEKERYEDTLQMIGRLSPVLIIPGSDPGIYLSMRLSEDLGLKSNPVSIFRRIRDKYEMQKALELAGLRFIRSRIVHSEDEAAAFFRGEPDKRAVVKRTQGGASVDVFICTSEASVREAYRAAEAGVLERARPGESVVIQEYIEGKEYSLDTVSCEGRHAAVYGMEYLQRSFTDKGKLYNTDLYFSPDEAFADEIVSYCFRVLDCLGVQYGPVHSEFIVDEKGPVLVEVNARPAGSFQKSSYQDRFLVKHETAIALDSYFLDKESFFSIYPVRMHLRQPAAVKEIRLDRPIYVTRVKLTERLSVLESFAYAIDNGENCIYPKTTDLNTAGGIIYLTAQDEAVIKRDLDIINELEKHGLHELYEFEEISSGETDSAEADSAEADVGQENDGEADG